MKKTYILLMAAAALVLGACHHATHYQDDMPQGEDSGKYPAPQGLGYLGNDLAWEEIADVQSEITHLKYTVTGDNGVKEEKEFETPEEAASWIIPLPVGEYDVLVAANMNPANGFVLSETVPTKDVLSTLPDTYAKLMNPSSNPVQAWNGITHVVVENDLMATAHLNLDRLMALFTLQLTNVPEGTVIDVGMRNAAYYITLTEEREAGHWGLPSKEISEDVTLGQLNAANAQSAITEFKVYPTAKGYANTILLFHIKTNQGLELDYIGQAPAMENGRKYVLTLDYKELNPYMLITAATTINEWTDGWAISGEVLNPEQPK